MDIILFELLESIAIVCSIRIFSRTVSNVQATRIHITKNTPYFHCFVDGRTLLKTVLLGVVPFSSYDCWSCTLIIRDPSSSWNNKPFFALLTNHNLYFLYSNQRLKRRKQFLPLNCCFSPCTCFRMAAKQGSSRICCGKFRHKLIALFVTTLYNSLESSLFCMMSTYTQ